MTHEPEKIYWTIGEVADMIGLPTSTIRFWCIEHRLLTKRNRVGWRKFAQKDIDKLKQIHHEILSQSI